MASQFFSLSIFILLILICANGRSPLQKGENAVVVVDDRSHVLSTSTDHVKVKAVSRATDSLTTNYNDVLGLAIIVTQYPLLMEDNTDPCIHPIWSWIQCNSDANPRVIALNLNNRDLAGQLPDFSNMDALQIIDLSRNSLVGVIPSFLGTFPHLQQLNLGYNLFYGTVPDSLACNKHLIKLTLTGNSGLHVSDTCSTSNNSSPSNSNSDGYAPPPKKSNMPKILGGTISAFLVLFIGVGGFAIHRHKAKAAAAVAQASAMQGHTGPKSNIPLEEMPINCRHNMSP